MCVELKQSHTGVHSGQQLVAMISIFQIFCNSMPDRSADILPIP